MVGIMVAIPRAPLVSVIAAVFVCGCMWVSVEATSAFWLPGWFSFLVAFRAECGAIVEIS